MNNSMKSLPKLRDHAIPLALSLLSGFILAVLSLFLLRKTLSPVLTLVIICSTLLMSYLVYCVAADRSNDEKVKFRLFFVSLAASCLLFCFAFPPLSVPDEQHHYYATYWLSNIVLGEGEGISSNPMPVRASDKEFCDYMMWVAVEDGGLYEISGGVYGAIENVLDGTAEFSEGVKEVTDYDFTIGSENVVAKVGSLAGVLIARLLHLSPLVLFYLGRLGSAAFFICCALAAYRVAPKFKNAFVIVSLLPMTLHLAASYSYDSGIIGIALLLFALILKGVYGEGCISNRHLIAIVALSAALAPCKIVYSVVILLVLFIPSRRFSNRRKSLIFKFTVLAVCALSIVVFRSMSLGDVVASGMELSKRGDEYGRYYSLGTLITQPIATIKLFARTLITYGEYYLFTMLGGSLGWLQVNLEAPIVIIAAYGLLSFFGMQVSKFDEERVPALLRLTFVSLFGMCALGVMLSMCLGHTFDTELVIRGVQGRYFLPVLPLLLVAARSNMIAVRRLNETGMLVASFTALNFLYLVLFLRTAFLLP